MALEHLKAGGAVLAVVAGCGGGNSVQSSASASARNAGPAKTLASPRACQIGQLSDAVPRMQIDTLVSNPDAEFGRRVVLRGYFILEGVETTALLEPDRRKAHILLGIRRLPVETAGQLLVCRSKLVDVQGYITHVPSRGGEALIVYGEAMVGVAE
jgi:hypothetical protein